MTAATRTTRTRTTRTSDATAAGMTTRPRPKPSEEATEPVRRKDGRAKGVPYPAQPKGPKRSRTPGQGSATRTTTLGRTGAKEKTPVLQLRRTAEEEPTTLRERRRHLRLVPLRKSRRRRRFLVVGAFALGAFTMFSILLVHVRIAQSAFELQREERRLSETSTQHQSLELQAADLDAPTRIRQEATDRLGMGEPQVIHFLHSASAAQQPAAPTSGESTGDTTHGQNSPAQEKQQHQQQQARRP